ncbi:MAG: hypothetical protein NC393_13060 [Clostridium sp.]|nr:hypothetical protein [Clostridium sp.]MCM1173039.1 hypothetical protein [Clostridium sp.]
MNITAVKTAASRYDYYTNKADRAKKGQSADNTEELFGKRENDVPYGYLANDGVITYQGVTFVCDYEKNRLLLGDCSNPKNCINVPLSGGGNLIFNRDNIGSISQAIGMFSPEDISRIMRAIAEDAKSKQVQNDIDEEIDETVGGLADSANGVSDNPSSDTKETSNDDRVDDYDTDLSASNSSEADYMKKIQEKIEEIYQKLINGDTEVSYQIGGESMTEKEWDMLLAKFDAVQEDVRELAEEEQEKRVQDEQKLYALDEKDNVLYDNATATLKSLISEISMCHYPDDAGERTLYITCYTEEGIFCRQQGQTDGFLWSIKYSERSQYEKVTNFLNNFNRGDNLRFASHENFWRDFLSDTLDTEEFMDFWDTTDNGIPDYTRAVGDSIFIDNNKIKFAKYMNRSSFVFVE